MNVIVPVGTKRGTVIGLNGIPVVLCKGDVDGCYETIIHPPTYLNASGVETMDKCEAVAVQLPAGSTCGCGERRVLVPDTLAATLEAGADGAVTALYTTNYANDGSAIPNLATSGAVYVGYHQKTDSCSSGSMYDSLVPSAPDGFAYVWLNVASAHDALS